LSGLPPVNRFTPTQIIHGAILTCTSTSTTATSVGCQGMKLNGMDIRLDFPEAQTICGAVTGPGGGLVGSGPGTASVPYFIWNGSNWALASATVAPMQDLTCFLAAALTNAAAQRSTTRTRGLGKVTIRLSSQGRKGR
jgi:hypothetical protein